MDITVKNISKLYGSQKAVDDISFEVKTGEILGFLGPNGAGKTTTMKMITSYLTPNNGEITLDGISVTENPDEIKKRIGYLPENNPLYLDMAIYDYLKFCGELYGISKDKLNSRIDEMINVCGLTQEKHKYIGELSKGYRQRVGLAQAMLHDPEVLILDEPTTGLDPNQIVEIRKLIRELGKEKTVILSTHILPEVEATCDRILIINNGKIVADGSSEQLKKQAKGTETLIVKIEDGDANEIYNALQSLDTIELVDFADRTENRFEIQSGVELSSKRNIFNLCVEKGWVLTEMTAQEENLEEIFRSLTKN